MKSKKSKDTSTHTPEDNSYDISFQDFDGDYQRLYENLESFKKDGPSIPEDLGLWAEACRCACIYDILRYGTTKEEDLKERFKKNISDSDWVAIAHALAKDRCVNIKGPLIPQSLAEMISSLEG